MRTYKSLGVKPLEVASIAVENGIVCDDLSNFAIDISQSSKLMFEIPYPGCEVNLWHTRELSNSSSKQPGAGLVSWWQSKPKLPRPWSVSGTGAKPEPSRISDLPT